MISSTIEQAERGDESSVCNRIARYTSRIQKRDTELTEKFGDPFGFTRSTCPIESGVVFTRWGAVKAGLVLAGIAAGYQHMSITTSTGVINNIYASTISGMQLTIHN